MTQPPEYSTLDIEQRGANFALVRTLGDSKMELPLLESEIFSLAHIFPSYAQALAARKARPGISAWACIPLKKYALNSDLHNQLLLMRFIDTNDAEFDFSFTPAEARDLAQNLTNWAILVEETPKPTQQ
jgi:hypothetical protein